MMNHVQRTEPKIISIAKTGIAIQSHYPRSFLKLLLIAFGAVALPMVLALVNAAVYVDRLAGQSRSAVTQAAKAARGSRMLMENVTGLERVVRQYLVLGDRELLGDYDQLRAGFKGTTSELSLLPLDELQLRELNRTIEKEQDLYGLLHRPGPKPADKTALIQGFGALSDLARGVLDVSNELIDREIERMRRDGEHARDMIWRQLLAAVPVGLLIAAGVSFLVARPIRQLDSAIRRIGAGELGDGIRVRGPADLEYLGERLDWLRRRLSELEEQKRLFLRHVSHELKTPLTALREGSALLAEEAGGPLSTQQREIVAILRDKSAQLQQQIEDLLNYHLAQESVGRLNLAPVRLDELVARVVEDQQLAARARGIRTDMRLDPVTLRGDAEKLRVVIDNLLSNAIKYSPEGGIISMGLRRERNWAIIDVGDTGPGIPAEDREHVFEWFFRGDSGQKGRVKGSGLGLAIAKEFVSAHGGQIDVVDDGAQGAHFRAGFPLS